MFGFKSEEVTALKKTIKELEESEVEARKDTRVAKDALASVKNDKKMEEENIKHMVKMTKEKDKLELEKKTMEIEKEHFKKLEVVKDEYRTKLEDLLVNQIKDAKESHEKLMEHMPKIEAMFSNQPKGKGK